MRALVPLVTVILLSINACESEYRRSAVYAEKCKEAERKGFLEGAEQLCQSAWFDVNSDRLPPGPSVRRNTSTARVFKSRHLNADAR